MTTNPRKIKVVKRRLTPSPPVVKELRGFMWLTRYCRKFIRWFGVIIKPLTELLKKNNFSWNGKPSEAFNKLKYVFCKALILVLPNFNNNFMLEMKAYVNRLDIVLSHDGRSLTFFSKALSLRHLGLLIYNKEYGAILMAIER